MIARDKIALVLFAREPRPGRVKSRLAKDLGEIAACDIYRAMAEDTWSNMKATGHVCILSSDTEKPWLPDPVHTILQPDGNFGWIIQSVLKQVNEQGFDGVIALGADTPHLPPALVEEAAKALLSGDDLVSCPSDDGGLVLLGLKLPLLIELNNLPFETDILSKAIMVEGKDLLHTRLTPGSYDIDDLQDIYRLTGDTEDVRNNCPNTIKEIKKIL